MNADSDVTVACPVHESRNDSKTARIAQKKVVPEQGSLWIRSFSQLQDVLQRKGVSQSGVGGAPIEQNDPTSASIFFLEGDAHRRRKMAITPFFSPKAVATRHMRVMQDNTAKLMAEFKQNGEGRLDDMAHRLAVAVAAEIVGLTNSNAKAMARRIAGAFSGAILADRGGFAKLVAPLVAALNALSIYYFDVRPAIAARRAQRKEDVISRLLDENRTNKEILIECMTFGLAGMTTTKEFIVMAAWHLFERTDLRQRFLDSDDNGKTAILVEILRLEPVASMIYRSTAEELTGITPDAIPAGTRLSLDIRAANLDEKNVGACPHMLDADRAKKVNETGAYLSFGNGPHFCPGRYVALGETRVFLDELFRIPGIRLVRPPDIGFHPPLLMSYELNNAIIACDKVGD
jgi:cytochrome P450